MDFDKETKAFIEQIRKSETYIKYKEARKELEMNPELTSQVDDYRRKQYELQSITSSEELYERSDVFEREFAGWKEQPQVNNFLEAELALCRMMQSICMQMVDELEFDW